MLLYYFSGNIDKSLKLLYDIFYIYLFLLNNIDELQLKFIYCYYLVKLLQNNGFLNNFIGVSELLGEFYNDGFIESTYSL